MSQPGVSKETASRVLHTTLSVIQQHGGPLSYHKEEALACLKWSDAKAFIRGGVLLNVCFYGLSSQKPPPPFSLNSSKRNDYPIVTKLTMERWLSS